jgi:hypothetical protein
MRGDKKKKSAKSNLEIIHAANLDRVAYWRNEHLLRQYIGAGIRIFGSYI